MPAPCVWSPDCRAHHTDTGLWMGLPVIESEAPARVDVLRATLESAGHDVVRATPHADTELLRVHDAALVEYLRGAYDEWVAAGYVESPGQPRVVPYVFPTPAMLGLMPGRRPTAAHARAGCFGYDTMTLVGPGTWTAARAAIDCALTAADLVLAGTQSAFALCRPPGHHATRAGFGGSCFLNNAAVAASALRVGGHRRVAVVDLDAHHGNGTQEIFWQRGDVLYASTHVDPAAGWFPHFVGFADETGAGAGREATVNRPLPPGTGDDIWLPTVESLAAAVSAYGADALVVSLGVDAAAGDPESPLEVSTEGYAGAGRMLGRLGLPTVAVLEGGYDLPTIGGLVAAFLAGLA